MSNDFDFEYLHEGACLPEIAACLILDVDPNQALQKHPTNFGEFTIHQKKLKI